MQPINHMSQEDHYNRNDYGNKFMNGQKTIFNPCNGWSNNHDGIIYKSGRFYTTPCDQIQEDCLELLNDELFLGIVGEFVRAEQVTVVKCRQAVDVNLSGLRTKKKKKTVTTQIHK